MTTWYTGMDSYKKHTITDQEYVLELQDKETLTDRGIFDIFNDHLKNRQTKIVEVLYSGGLDSELVLYGCIHNRIPVQAVTMRLHIDNIPVNVHDLYYSEKFCREHSVRQKIVDLDIRKFFDSGEYEQYLHPYQITKPHVATHMWLFEQCSGYPVLGGEYPWPWTTGPRILSPIRYEYSNYDRFLREKGIDGIGNMLDHSLESISLLIKTHVEVMKDNAEYGGSGIRMAKFKAALYKTLGHTSAEPRSRSFGWEIIPREDFSKPKYELDLLKRFGTIKSKIKWGSTIASILETSERENSLF
jgi:hypothetical protein